MSDHNPDVAAVLAETIREIDNTGWSYENYANGCLAALTAAGIACVYVPEGVAVAHGARLVVSTWTRENMQWVPLYAIEDTP